MDNVSISKCLKSTLKHQMLRKIFIFIVINIFNNIEIFKLEMVVYPEKIFLRFLSFIIFIFVIFFSEKIFATNSLDKPLCCKLVLSTLTLLELIKLSEINEL